MSEHPADHFDADLATAVVRRYVNPRLTVTGMRHLHGGMINRVWELATNGQPALLVVKVNEGRKAGRFEREMRILRWYRRHTRFPVPEPIACFGGANETGAEDAEGEEPGTADGPLAGFGGSGLLMEKIDGPNLADARLSARGMTLFQKQLADHVAELHQHHRATFGSALEPEGSPRWLDAFEPAIRGEFEAVKHLLGSRNRWAVQEMINHLEQWLPERSTPTLTHGDLWATNILVDDTYPDRPRLQAFIDCGAGYCDPEYELAYLRIFRTADETFFEHYTKYHALRPGFDRRCRIYWLNTMMAHVRLFGDQYLPRCEDLARQIRQLS